MPLAAEVGSLRGEVVLEEGEAVAVLAVIGDSDAGRAHDLPRVPVLVHLAEAGPLPELLVVRHGDERDAPLLAERGDELLVRRLRAVLRKQAHLRLLVVE